jgi:protein SCO1
MEHLLLTNRQLTRETEEAGRKMSKFSLILAGVVIGLALSMGGAWWFLERNYTYQGVVIDPPAPAPEITLTDQNGKEFQLSRQKGRIALIFFGYTNCMDVCPITLSQFKQIKTILGDQAAEVNFIFITVDPKRDNPDRIQAWLENFDPDFIGLTGTQHDLEAVWKEYGVFVESQDSDSGTGYGVDHASRIYVIDKTGQWRLNYPFGMDSKQIAQDIAHLLRQ